MIFYCSALAVVITLVFGVTIFNCKVSDEHVYFCKGKRKIVAGRGQSGGRVDS